MGRLETQATCAISCAYLSGVSERQWVWEGLIYNCNKSSDEAPSQAHDLRDWSLLRNPDEETPIYQTPTASIDRRLRD